MVTRLLLQTAIWMGGMGAVLFICAGTLHWPQAWAYLLTTVVLGLAGGLWFMRIDPDLLEERMKPWMQADQPRSDKIFMVAFGCVALIWLIVMGLDRRWAVSSVPLWLEVLGLALLVISVCFTIWVMRENTFAAPAVKVQTERGHHVVSTGPYAWVRHPMYSGALLFFAGTALLLGSWWGFAMVPLLIAMFAVRAVNEERTLVAGLPGYADYKVRVRYRLVPGLW
jgi:protein-S-isoprenylcysteine O-methyltransferase Ste14